MKLRLNHLQFFFIIFVSISNRLLCAPDVLGTIVDAAQQTNAAIVDAAQQTGDALQAAAQATGDGLSVAGTAVKTGAIVGGLGTYQTVAHPIDTMAIVANATGSALSEGAQTLGATVTSLDAQAAQVLGLNQLREVPAPPSSGQPATTTVTLPHASDPTTPSNLSATDTPATDTSGASQYAVGTAPFMSPMMIGIIAGASALGGIITALIVQHQHKVGQLFKDDKDITAENAKYRKEIKELRDGVEDSLSNSLKKTVFEDNDFVATLQNHLKDFKAHAQRAVDHLDQMLEISRWNPADTLIPRPGRGPSYKVQDTTNIYNEVDKAQELFPKIMKNILEKEEKIVKEIIALELLKSKKTAEQSGNQQGKSVNITVHAAPVAASTEKAPSAESKIEKLKEEQKVLDTFKAVLALYGADLNEAEHYAHLQNEKLIKFRKKSLIEKAKQTILAPFSRTSNKNYAALAQRRNNGEIKFKRAELILKEAKKKEVNGIVPIQGKIVNHTWKADAEEQKTLAQEAHARVKTGAVKKESTVHMSPKHGS